MKEWVSPDGRMRLINGDCMDFMRGCNDGEFQLAIVDPPYGIGESGSTNKSRGKLAIAKDYKPFFGGDKTAPNKDFFDELMNVSRNQIIWGANHFISIIPYDSPAWVVWDKKNGDNDFADCELAWTSFNIAVRKFEFRWAGMLQGNMAEKETRIHPTQKPVALYRWLLQNYAKPGDRILDTHVGSASSFIAAWEKGFEIVGCELDADYFDDAVARIQKAMQQPQLDFEGVQSGPKMTEQELF
jgi:site-specific DNA-methyltransferase (adenine-specific)